MSDARNKNGGNNFAALKNVAAMMGLVTRIQNRNPHEPGIGVFSGWSGLGKTYAATYAHIKTRGYRVEIGDSWTRRSLLRAILKEMGVNEPRGTVADMAEEVIMRLGENPATPLFIDEAHLLVEKRMIELVRELYEKSQVPVILIGEEMLPAKLAQIERVHNRVLEWRLADPCDLDDTKKLAAIFAPGIAIHDELLDRVRIETEGRARRIVVNLSSMSEYARQQGFQTLDPANFKGTFYTSKPPVRGKRAA